MKKLLLIATFVCGRVPGSIAVSTSVAQAKSVQCNEAGVCVVYCSQTLSNGNFIEYEEGTVITSTDASGVTRKFKCVNGQWVQQASLVSGAGLAGMISPVGIASFKIAEDDTTLSGLKIVPDEGWNVILVSCRPDFGGCNPNKSRADERTLRASIAVAVRSLMQASSEWSPTSGWGAAPCSGVLGHQLGDSRLIGGLPPRALS